MAIVDTGTQQEEDENTQLGTTGTNSLLPGNSTPSINSSNSVGGAANASGVTANTLSVPGGGNNTTIVPGAGSNANNTVGSANTNSGQANNGFIDLSQYLSENQPQVNQLSGKVGNFIEDQSKNAYNAINQAQQGFTNDANANTITENTGLVNQATSNPIGFVGASTDTNPNSNLQSLLAQENATYKGPTDFNTSKYYAPADSAVQQAVQYGNDIGNSAGQTALIQALGQSQGANYNQGEMALDQSLLGSTPTSNQILQSGASSTSGLQAALADAASKANAAAAAAGLTTSQTQQAVTNAVQTAQTQWQQNLQNSVNTAQNTALANQTNLQKALQNQTVSPQQLSALGITQDQYNNLVNLNKQNTNLGGSTNLSQWFTPGNTSSITANNVATPNDYAMQNALDLEGQNNNQFITTPTNAGSAPSNIGSYNYNNATQQLQQDITSAQQQQQNNQNAKNIASSNSGINPLQVITTIASIASSAAACSDIRIKCNIELDSIKNGFNLYKFNYIWDLKTTYLGVIAQEVQTIMPEAVKELNGYLTVDYKMLGLECLVIESNVDNLELELIAIAKSIFPAADDATIKSSLNMINLFYPDKSKAEILEMAKEVNQHLSLKCNKIALAKQIIRNRKKLLEQKE